MKKQRQIQLHKCHISTIAIAMCMVVLSGCVMHAPGKHAVPLKVLRNNATNVYILQQRCDTYYPCTFVNPPVVFVNGLELGREIACSNSMSYDYGSACELSSRDGPLLIDVLGGVVPPSWIVDYELEISAEPTYVWITKFGRKIEVVPREQACRGEHEDFKRPFPVPDICEAD